MLWLFIAYAATLPQPSDVVFVHADVAEEQQDDFNYIFTVDGDDAIYTCQANRCSLSDFRDQPVVTATFYQLPEGYQRVATVVDQSTLAEYRANAVQEFRLENIETTLAAAGSNRSYHTVTIQADGNFDQDTVSQERNATTDVAAEGKYRWVWWLIGGGVVIAAGAGFILWKLRF
ncbi:MAG: hypothetical protein ACD_41C00249G0002 [uncultured bacterium]|nr:MAG: hypothetical protein ACD_41C00249G0002 [uncultured bacterium]HBY74040.1 hypothetical protein [Candidatus Kerfeldbacteria bacterium]